MSKADLTDEVIAEVKRAAIAKETYASIKQRLGISTIEIWNIRRGVVGADVHVPGFAPIRSVASMAGGDALAREAVVRTMDRLTVENAALRHRLEIGRLEPMIGGVPIEKGTEVVYFICRGDGTTKVGRTVDFRRRWHEHLDIFGAWQPILLSVVAGSPAVEKRWHARFRDRRCYRESFMLRQDDIPATDFAVAPFNEMVDVGGYWRTCPVCGSTFAARNYARRVCASGRCRVAMTG